jgi:hypothetical protein
MRLTSKKSTIHTLIFVITHIIPRRRLVSSATDDEQQQEDLLLTQLPSIGATQASFVVLNDQGRRRLHFVAPVQLAPLQRKRVRTSRKLVPLIEPDICNYVRMDFLPDAVLRLPPADTNVLSNPAGDAVQNTAC